MVPTGPKGETTPFCHLRLDYLDRLRIAVDYAAALVSHPQAAFGLNVVQETFQTIASHTAWAL